MDATNSPRPAKKSLNIDWDSYYNNTQHEPVRKTVEIALKHFNGRTGIAADIGCGAGNDTLPLLHHGWTVYGFDKTQSGLDALEERAKNIGTGVLHTVCGTYADINIPPVDLVVSNYALPFCHPADFAGLWAQIRSALRAGGVFAGNFFGPQDGWAHVTGMTFTDTAQVRALVAGMEILYFEERVFDKPLATGEPKQWHTIDVVALRAP